MLIITTAAGAAECSGRGVKSDDIAAAFVRAGRRKHELLPFVVHYVSRLERGGANRCAIIMMAVMDQPRPIASKWGAFLRLGRRNNRFLTEKRDKYGAAGNEAGGPGKE